MRIDELEKRFELLEKFVDDLSTQTKKALDLVAKIIQIDLDRRAL